MFAGRTDGKTGATPFRQRLSERDVSPWRPRGSCGEIPRGLPESEKWIPSENEHGHKEKEGGSSASFRLARGGVDREVA